MDPIRDAANSQSVPAVQLNQDCLIQVFQQLPIVDRIRLERVCRFWQASSLESWRDFKQLSFHKECWGFRRAESVDRLNNRTLRKVLKRCGRYLREISFPDANRRLGCNVLELVARHCPHVRYIYALELEIWPRSIRSLADGCREIVSLSLGSCSEECDRELGLLFASNPQLKWFSMRANYYVTGECLRQLNRESIKTIMFEHCTALELKHFGVVREFKNLTEIAINHCHDTDESVIEAISSATSLQSLTLSLCVHTYDSLGRISSLTNLEMLDLSHNCSVNDRVLLAIGAHLRQLQILDISFCESVTDAGLARVVGLPQLQFLYVENLDKITDQVFAGMPSLRCVDVSHCPNVGNAGIKALIEASHNVEFLYLNGCPKITNELLEAAIVAARGRKNNVALNMHVCQTRIEFSKASDVPPLLQVVPTIFINFL